MTKRLVLIDGNALVHRAFHALPPTLSSPKGRPVNAVYGFTSVFLKMLSDLKPDYIAATFDLAGPTFRHEEFEDYKANRVKAPDELYAQIPLVKNVLSAFGVPVYEKTGFEADDVIGTIAEITRSKKDLQTVIVTGDMDTLQLVQGDKVVVFTLRKGMTDTIIYDEKEVEKRYGITPDQMPDYKGLKGDPSDNIPGVKGIGDKTAVELIKAYGSIENLYNKISDYKLPVSKKDKYKKPLSAGLLEKLILGKDMAIFSKRLATIVRDADIDFRLQDCDFKKKMKPSDVETIFREFGFYSLLKRLPSYKTQQLDFEEQPKTATPERGKTASLGSTDLSGETAVNIAGDGLIYIFDGKKTYGSKIEKSVASLAGSKLIIGYDLKPLAKLFIENDALIPALFDLKIAAWLLSPDSRNYDYERIFFDNVGRRPADNPADLASGYAELKTILFEKLQTAGLLKLFTDLEMPLIPILAKMETNGIKVDTGVLKELSLKANSTIAGLEDSIYKKAGLKFNINSPQQLSDVIFNKLGLKGKVRKTGKGALSTAADELEKIRDEHPIIGQVLEYRELQKLKTTYIDVFPTLVARDGRIHTTYNQTGTATGRLSSQDPNLQNIPTRTELGQEFRKSFVAENKKILISFDYSQLELRIVAHVAGDKKMSQAFERGEDIHTRTASEIFKVPADSVTKDMRRQAKVLNFGIIYGMGIHGFARSAGVDRNKAKEFIDKYFEEFSGVAAYMENTKNQAGRLGYVETIFGRKRYLPDIRSGIPQLKAQAERMAINHPLQGTGADLVKMAMISTDRLLTDKKYTDRVKLLLQVHDELVIEADDDIADDITELIRTEMQNVFKLNVPLVVDAKIGENWAEMKIIGH